MTYFVENEIENINRDEYLIFVIGGEIFATPILDVVEVNQLSRLRQIPNTIPALVGAINLRGRVISVLDLRVRFGAKSPIQKRQPLIIVEQGEHSVAILVDKVLRVEPIGNSEIDTKVAIKSLVPLPYIRGLKKNDSEILLLLDLKKIVTDEELVTVEKMLA